MRSRDVVKLLKSKGWTGKSQNGSHLSFVHKNKTGKVTIPVHNKDLKPKTLNSILKQAGLK